MNDLDSIKAEITARVGLVDVASEHVSLIRRGGRLVGLCPFHNEKTPSFYVSPDKGFFKCFGCGRGGDVFTFVMLRENVDFGEALRILADRAGVQLKRSTGGGVPKGVDRVDLARINAWAADYFHRCLKNPHVGASAARYLDTRGVQPPSVARFMLGFAGDDLNGLTAAARGAGISVDGLVAADLARRGERGDLYCTFRNRVMFPIRDAMNRVVGFGGRTLGDDPAKYLNTRQTVLFDKSRVLYGVDQARTPMTQSGRSVVVEGYLDCIAAHQAGFAETVATLGTAMSEAHVQLLRRYAGVSVFLFDADSAGEAAAERALRVALPRHLEVKLARVPDGKDPADFLQAHSGQDFAGVLNSAVDALEFKWNLTLRRFEGGGGGRARNEAVDELLTHLRDASQSGSLDEISRGAIFARLAGLAEIPVADVHRLYDRRMRRPVSRSSPAAGPNAAATPAEVDDQARDEEQDGLRIMLEVLLNEPGLFEAVRDVFAPQRFRDRGDARIAQVVADLAETVGEFHLAEVIARFEDPQLTSRATELALAGERIGNFQRRLIEVARTKVENAASTARGRSIQSVKQWAELAPTRRRSRFVPPGKSLTRLNASWAVKSDNADRRPDSE